MEERRNLPRREFIEQYFPYIRGMIVKMGRDLPPGMEFNDLLSSAVIGLITSIDRYDSEKNDSFIAFARERIKGAVIDSFRKHDKFTRFSRGLLKNYEKAYIELANKLQREPDHVEVIDSMDLTKKQIESLNTLLTVENGIEQYEFDKMLVYSEDLLEQINKKQIVRIELPKAISYLNEREQEVIISYFFHDKPLREIGEDLNVTESRASQIKISGLKKLRRKLEAIKEEL